MGDRQPTSKPSRYANQPARSTQPGHPFMVSTMSTIESCDVYRYNARCTGPVLVVSQCKLLSGRGLRKRLLLLGKNFTLFACRCRWRWRRRCQEGRRGTGTERNVWAGQNAAGPAWNVPAEFVWKTHRRPRRLLRRQICKHAPLLHAKFTNWSEIKSSDTVS